MCEKYNGWTNRETWLANVWGFAEYDTDELEAYRDNPYALSKELESRVEEMLPEVDGFVSDLLSGALARIDYYELADTMLADLPDEEV
jgi:hypothetical protein